MPLNKWLIYFCLTTMFAHAPARADTPMTFYMETNPSTRITNKLIRAGIEDIYASGEITQGTTDRFLAFVINNRVESAKIHFNSPGGSLAEGMKLGRAIRTLQFFTAIGVYSPTYEPDVDRQSTCASACAYAFAGGTSRFINDYTGKLGIHQFYTTDGTSVSGEAVQQISGLVVAYLDEMGVDAKAFTVSTIADRNGMIWLTPDDALNLRFANNGTEPPIAEIKLSGMTPYLRVQQDHHNVTIRILFACKNQRLRMNFGIVTSPEWSAMIAENQKRSYLETDYVEALVIPGDTGAVATNSVVWLERQLTPKIVRRQNIWHRWLRKLAEHRPRLIG
ncbi:hypothetical protein HUO14_00005 [Parasphingorhabdus flavimaris]|uniref:Uncharacterized protein n=1 Tax=Parasphingorhabdus flavimaris TaxID=266812 RepID=A0ABX2MXW3_9SPHN|nr:hypothetical protein [Parasphingorhabdus flavimaris]NVD26279.1 hypothetical protein [Parasphingorhabdus flavimaris]